MYIPTKDEFDAREMRFNDIENMRIHMLIKFEKEYEIPSDIMDHLAYDVEFEETLEHENPEKMRELIIEILKDNYEIII